MEGLGEKAGRARMMPNELTLILYSVMISKIMFTRRFRQCVEVHVSRVSVWTDKAGRRIVKGARAEERYLLIGILSGCIVNSYMSVTGIIRRLWYGGYV